MNVRPLALPDVLLLAPRLFHDERGHFLELWHASRYAEAGLPDRFVQDNVSVSKRGVLRGLHLQHPAAQGKLVSCPGGSIFDVAVDVRIGSPMFGRWVGEELSGANGHQLWIPPGFAHGFLVLSAEATVIYKCSTPYQPASELSVRWDDPAIGIVWPEAPTLLSSRDAAAPLLAEISPERLPHIDTAG